MQTSERLKGWRNARGLTQEGAATLVTEQGGVAVEQATWSRLESGKSMPGLVLAVAIEKVTDGLIAAENWTAMPRPRRRAKKRANKSAARAGKAA